MASISSTPKNHTYSAGEWPLFHEPTSTDFEVGTFVEPKRKHTIKIRIGEAVDTTITVSPLQHWKVVSISKDNSTIVLSYKFATISIMAKHAKEIFEKYEQTPDGKRLYPVYKTTNH